MKATNKRVFSCVLSLAMCLSLVQFPAFAAETAQGHQHTMACYRLTCEEDHIHDWTCFAQHMPYECGLEEGQTHMHNENRMTCEEVLVYTCGKEEHIHTSECEAEVHPSGEVQPGDVEIPAENDEWSEEDSFGNDYSTLPEILVAGEDGVGHAPDEDAADPSDTSGSENEGIDPHSEDGIAPMDDDAVLGDEDSEEGIAPMDDDTASTDEDSNSDAAAEEDDTTPAGDESEESEESSDEDSVSSSDGDEDSAHASQEDNTEIPEQDPPLSNIPSIHYSCGKAEHQHSEACGVEILYVCRPMENSGCICEYRCSPLIQKPWWDDDGNRIYIDYVTRNEDCPVCGGEDGDWEHNCEGKQVIADGNPNHTHTWFTGFGIWGTVPANCTTPKAVTLLDRSCGAEWLFAFEKDSEIDPDTHYYSDYNAITDSKAATCTEDGYETYMPCLLCGEVVTKVVPAKGHTIDEDTVVIVKEATCMEDGLITGHCTVCGEDTEEVIPAIGHQKPEEGVVVTPVSCTEDGHTVYTCTVCHEEVDEVIPTSGHSWPEGKVSHEEQGVCTACGATAYWVFTYEDGATPSGNGYETHLCARVIQEADGTVYGVDTDGRPVDSDSFTIAVNESLMGKVKVQTDSEGNAVMTQVTGYRNMDHYHDESPLYKIGDEVFYEDVPGMYADKVNGKPTWGAYYSANSHKTVYLRDVREPVKMDEEIRDYGKMEIQSVNVPAVRPNSSNVSVSHTVSGPKEEDGHHFFDVDITVNIGPGTTGVIDVNPVAGILVPYAEPGDTIRYHITLDNQSGLSYSYVSGSGKIATAMSLPGGGEVRGVGFDGNELPGIGNDGFDYLSRRLVGEPLKMLGFTDAMSATDAAVGKVLRDKGYGADSELTDEDITKTYLSHYYLDFLNDFREANNQALANDFQDLTISEFAVLTGGATGTNMPETCREVVEALYYCYYGKVLELNGMCIYDHMAENSRTIDSLWNTTVNTSGSIELTETIAGEEANNGYQNTEALFRMQFQLNLSEQPQVTSLTVNKVWNDAGNSGNRPGSIVVGLYNGTAAQEYVTLNDGNGWTHTWENLDAGGDWRVAEVHVPGYTGSQTREDNAITITNTPTTPPPENPPPSGNTPRDPNPNPPPVVTEIPDPNVPGAPEEVVVVNEEDVPLTYVKTWDPEEEEFVYVPEEEVPLADVTPETGDPGTILLYAGMNLTALTGMGALLLTNPRKKEEEQPE